MAKAPFDPYTLDLFENLLPLEDGVEVETNHANEAPDQTGDIELTTKVDHAADWIADFGEKIGGAKKDLWANYAQDLQLATEADFLSQPFSKVWPSPNYQRMLAAGADPYQVAFVRTLRESITPKPKSGYKARAWVGRSLVLRDLCADLLSGRHSTDSAKQFLSTNTRLNALTHKIALYELLGHERSLANFELSLHSYSRYQGVDYQPAKLLWVLSERRSKTSWPRELLSAETYSQIIDRIDQQRESLFPSAISANGRAEGNLGSAFLLTVPLSLFSPSVQVLAQRNNILLAKKLASTMPSLPVLMARLQSHGIIESKTLLPWKSALSSSKPFQICARFSMMSVLVEIIGKAPILRPKPLVMLLALKGWSLAIGLLKDVARRI